MPRTSPGTWRDEHLFNLASALQLFDALTEMVASYEARLTEELAALTPPDEPEAPAATRRPAPSCGASRGWI